MNHLMIAGNLGADPEVRFTPSGKKVTTLRVAAKSRRNKEETIWWRVTVWGEEHDAMLGYFKKGSSIMVSGEMDKAEIYTNKEGKTQVSLNMTASALYFSPFGKADGSSPSSTGQVASQAAPVQNSGAFVEMPQFSEEEVPF